MEFQFVIFYYEYTVYLQLEMKITYINNLRIWAMVIELIYKL